MGRVPTNGNGQTLKNYRFEPNGNKMSSLLQQAPNDSIKFSSIPGGDHVGIPVVIPAGKTLHVHLWGARTDTETTPSGLTVELFDETNTTSIKSENTKRTADESLATLSAGSSDIDATLRLDNATGSSQDAGAFFGYEVI